MLDLAEDLAALGFPDVALRGAADDSSVEVVECCKQRERAVPDAVVSRRAHVPDAKRQGAQRPSLKKSVDAPYF